MPHTEYVPSEEEQHFDDVSRAIFSMFSTPQGQLVLEDLNNKLKEATYNIGEPPENAVYREGSRQAFRWLVDSYNKQKG